MIRRKTLTLLVAGAALWSAAAVAAGPPRGFVDGTIFAELAGDEDSVIEINLPGSLLRLACSVEPALCDAVKGVHSLRAVIVELEGDDEKAKLARARDEIGSIRSRLARSGWQSLVRIREKGSNLHVLLLHSEDSIDGLALMGVDDDEILFVNIAGTVDLAALQRIGEHYDLPGFDELGDLEDLQPAKGEQ